VAPGALGFGVGSIDAAAQDPVSGEACLCLKELPVNLILPRSARLGDVKTAASAPTSGRRAQRGSPTHEEER
jgi:hypothetical protein